MYSLILMTAMAAGPDTTSFGGRMLGGGCCGGCYGGAPVSCYGGCSGYAYGCCGYSYGCCGGGGLFAHHHARKACHGCYGGAYLSYGGCCGGYYGSCYGSCYGGGAWGAYGAYGAWGAYSGAPLMGCLGGAYYGAPGGVVVGGPVIVGSSPAGMAPTVTVPPAGAGASSPSSTDKSTAPGSPTSALPAGGPARLTIELPASATLYVDGKPTKGEGASRLFHTPPLPAGQSFFYEMRAEVEVGGKIEVEEKRVVVRAGDQLTESFPKLIAMVGSAGNAVAAK